MLPSRRAQTASRLLARPKLCCELRGCSSSCVSARNCARRLGNTIGPNTPCRYSSRRCPWPASRLLLWGPGRPQFRSRSTQRVQSMATSAIGSQTPAARMFEDDRGPIATAGVLLRSKDVINGQTVLRRPYSVGRTPSAVLRVASRQAPRPLLLRVGVWRVAQLRIDQGRLEQDTLLMAERVEASATVVRAHATGPNPAKR